MRKLIPALLAVGAVCALVIMILMGSDADTLLRNVTEATSDARYVGSTSCASCHNAAYASWQTSHHAMSMQTAKPDSVRGDFANRELKHHGTVSRFFRDGEAYKISTPGVGGKLETFQVPYTFGWYPLQQYLVEFPGGRLQATSVAWDSRDQRWFHLHPTENIAPDDWLHWTQPSQNWNYMCASCHSTNQQINHDLKSNTYKTTWSEINVGCEACHGPGSQHAALAKMIPSAFLPAFGVAGDAKQNSSYEIESCAPCHSRRTVIDPNFRPGKHYLDHFDPELISTDAWFEDGQIRDENFEYASFLQSRMYRNGVSCSDCHEPHSAKLRTTGNALCTRCHEPVRYDTTNHHHHTADSTAAQCVSCHMPERVYMQVDGRRDHSIRVPRPDLSVKLGTPNACNTCHAKETPTWASEHVTRWFGPKRRESPHHGEALAAGRAGSLEGEALLTALAQKNDVGPMIQASAVALLSRYSGEQARAETIRALNSPEALVRAAATRNLEYLPPEILRDHGPRMLKDPVRLVRVEAARVLSVLHKHELSEADQQFFARALIEFEQRQMAASDQPGSHLNLASVWLNQGQPARAEEAIRTALRLDPKSVQALLNLAMLYDSQDRIPEAEKRLREALTLAPRESAVHFSLGLLLARDNSRLQEAADALTMSVRLTPHDAAAQYNLGLVLQRLGRNHDAEVALLAAQKIAPTNTTYMYALAAFFAQSGAWDASLRWADQLLQTEPANQEWQILRQNIEQAAAR